jgi:hypothetical protein
MARGRTLLPPLLLRLIHLHAATLPPSPSPEVVLSQLTIAHGEPTSTEKAVRSLELESRL